MGTVLGIGLGSILVFGAGLLVGWFLLPAPAFIVNLWAKLGLAKKVV